jgi:GT2 family glycosyltransferase
MEPHVVVVLNFHGRDDTLGCVASLVEGSPEATVLVVDNGSFDGTLEAVRERWHHVEVDQSPQNLGFAGGMNRGLGWALDRGAETVTVLNNDTVVPAGVLASLAQTAASGVAVSPEVRYAATGRVWFGGGVVDAETGLARHLSESEIAERFPGPGLRSVETLAGCCLTATADVWRAVGWFDERYFLIFEDADWSMRAGARGVDLVVNPDIHIDHEVSASFTGDRALLGLYYYARNGLLFSERWRRHTGRGDRWTSARFLRRHVLPEITGAWRRGDHRAALERQAVLAGALADQATGRYGRAPRWLERLAARRSRASIPR